MHVAIVGAGIAGLSTAWALARRGHRVTVLEQAAEIPNPLAASGDQHRIIRRGYGTADGYAALLDEAFAAWGAMWADLGADHYAPTGVLCLCQYPGDEADDIRAGYDRIGAAYRRLEPAAAALRFPFLDPAGFIYATLTPEGGALLCQRIAAGLLGFLRARGCDVRAGTRVVGVDPVGGRVTTDTGVVAADRIVVAAGGWTTKLLEDLAPMLETRQTHVAYAEPPADLAGAWAGAPVILSVGGPSEAWAIPPVAGTGLKFGSGLMQYRSDADHLDPGDEARGRAVIATMAPPVGRLGEYRVGSVRSCVYTFTADETFFGMQRDRLTVVSACSGHGYKFGAAVGLRVGAAVESGDGEGLRRWLRAKPLAALA